MSQQAVETALGKLATDDTFRAAFFADPARAALSAGLRLSARELDALRQLPADAVWRFSACVDDRICRLSLGQATEEETK